MARGFYSLSDAELATGSANLISIVEPEPETYGLNTEIVANYVSVANTYNDLYALITQPSTRTPVRISEKNAARTALRTASVGISRIIQATPSVDNAMLLALNLPQRLGLQRVPEPTVAPVVMVTSVRNRTVSLRLYDQAEKRRGKPRFVAGASIFSFTGENPPSRLSDFKFERNVSTVKVELDFPDGTAPGTKVWFTAFWFNNRKQTSPMAAPISTNITGGGVSLAA